MGVLRRTMLKLVLFLLFLTKIQAYHRSNNHETKEPLLTTPSGKILGSIMTTRLNKPIYAFRGIQYATAKRFEPSVLIDKWSDVYNATEDGPICPQPVFESISEDCLCLNVYTTRLPTGGNNPKRPVIVYLHAGGFYAFTGHSAWRGPRYLMDKDIVLVTLNYRVGSLGFLSTGKLIPGNNGLKDQVQALKWVRKNIASFGGDPDCVTLYGYSAGSWSIILHMVSPMSQGLFHRAILGSGSSIGINPLPTNQYHLAQKQARIMNCPDDTPENIVNCLKTKSAIDIGNSLSQFLEFGSDSILIWTPTIERDSDQEKFLPDDPIKIIRAGKFAKIPVVIGHTENEMDQRAFPVITNETLYKLLTSDFEKYAPIAFVYERDTDKSKYVSRALRDYYLGDAISLDGLSRLYTDAIEKYPIYKAVRLLSEHNSENVYYYNFNYQGRYSYYYLPDLNNRTVPQGVAHHDDLIYSFDTSLLFPLFNQSDPESKMVEKLTTLWSNFAKTGNPTPKRAPVLDNIVWEPFNKDTEKYLDIRKNLILSEKLDAEKNAFWEKLYPI